MTVPIYEFPDHILEYRTASLVWRLVPTGVSSLNSYTGMTESSKPHDFRWEGQFSLIANNEMERLEVEVMAEQVQGIYGPFTIFSPAQPLPLGRATGIGTGASGDLTARFWEEDGTTWDDGQFVFNPGATVASIGRATRKGMKDILIAGLQPNQSLSLAKGDLFAINYIEDDPLVTYLHRVQGNASSDAMGNCNIVIEPGLREDVEVGHVVQFEKPRTICKFEGLPEVTIEPPLNASISFRCREWVERLTLPRVAEIGAAQ